MKKEKFYLRRQNSRLIRSNLKVKNNHAFAGMVIFRTTSSTTDAHPVFAYREIELKLFPYRVTATS